MSETPFTSRSGQDTDPRRLLKSFRIARSIASFSPKLAVLGSVPTLPEVAPRVRLPETCKNGALERILRCKLQATDRLVRENKENFEDFVAKHSPHWRPKPREWQTSPKLPRNSSVRGKSFAQLPIPQKEPKLPGYLPKLDFNDRLFTFEDPISKKKTSASLDWLIDRFSELFNEFVATETCSEAAKLARFRKLVAIDEFPHRDILLDLVLDRLGFLRHHINQRLISHEVTRIVYDGLLYQHSIGSMRVMDRRKPKMTLLAPPIGKQSAFLRLQPKSLKLDTCNSPNRRRGVSNRRLPTDFDFKPLLTFSPFVSFLQSLYRVVDGLLDHRHASTIDRLSKGFQEIEQLTELTSKLRNPGIFGIETSPKRVQYEAAARCKAKFTDLKPSLLEGNRPALRFYALNAFETESISLQKFFKNVQKFAGPGGLGGSRDAPQNALN